MVVIDDKPSLEVLWKLNRWPLRILNPCFYMRPDYC